MMCVAMSSILHHAVCDRVIVLWYVIVILQLTSGRYFLPTPLYVELSILCQTKFCGHHLLYNLYVSFIKHVSELLLAFPKIKPPFK